ncbi:DUF1194 domain-containing protein [Pelagovum pacificum]|uniref:DUF1194 domain-containing protein n=1 Tax=Pelagovum pacificum TaxID=2588711 RepID=A0A5C5G825_9RHOB|nr:DUF1194 domain-containing protein [Pelagovum pacificum]QQA41634.1 DUF1194 domain-containing protein [Pelagovum pacificum]TNY30913.1 DUF1194 domain-containing protein [Pelagovum pacificum]
MIRAALLLLAVIGASPAQAACRQALAIGLDVSGSVDQGEYRMQLDGLAGALGSEQVSAALLEGATAPVRLLVFEWSGPQAQRILLPWTDITDEAALQGAIDRLRSIERVRAEPTTAIGEATMLGARLLAEQSDCWQRTLDLSGDGKSNTGRRPQDVQAAELPEGLTVNGLVVGAEPSEAVQRRLVEIGELVAYFQAYVIRGPDAFVESALGFEDYEAAMTRKLLREIRSLAIGALDLPPD